MVEMKKAYWKARMDLGKHSIRYASATRQDGTLCTFKVCVPDLSLYRSNIETRRHN